MAWGDPGVSKKLRISNGVVTPGVGGSPNTVAIQQTGILEKLSLLLSGTATITAGTGTVSKDVLGPFNALTNVSLAPNQQAPVVQLSGYGLYLANVMKAAEPDSPFTVDTQAVSEASAAAAADIYNFPSATGTLRFWENVPITQRIRSLGGEVGYWPLQNPAMQLNLSYTLNSATSSSPYSIASATAGNSPYLVTGNGAATWTAPQIDVMRTMYQVPANASDFPPFQFVSTMIEEAPQGASIGSATSFTWQATPLSGLLARIGLFIFDSNASAGVANATLNLSNSLQLTYDANTVKFSESSYEALQRMQSLYRFAPPQGFYTWDLLGPDLTLQDTLNTSTTANIKLQVTAASAFGATSSAKIIRQIISPLEVK
jgi:hypothetical protein